MNDLLRKILTDIKVELSDEFDRNFERKAFFNKKWKDRRYKGKGTLLVATGKLRRSIRASVGENSVTWSSSEPYATIHNEGGEITVTRKMKSYFWAKYYEATGRIRHNKNGAMSKSSLKANAEAEFYKYMALMKVGSKITIPERRFIGDAPEVRTCVEKVFKENLKDIISELASRKH
ncbi:MAG: phage virion morphogenesis protein [Paludibacteraceae bacterium]|nr:phage virion morphogenesis protein [Paludibacteraceae bacterium]